MVNNGDNSLIGTNPNGINTSSIDEPDYSGGRLHLNHNPRTHQNNYFDSTAFSMNALGTAGNAKRRFFYGPGADDFDMAGAQKEPRAEGKDLAFRGGGGNHLNHNPITRGDPVGWANRRSALCDRIAPS